MDNCLPCTSAVLPEKITSRATTVDDDTRRVVEPFRRRIVNIANA
jgi:hypothetical protein